MYKYKYKVNYCFLLYEVKHEDLGQVNDEELQQEDLVKPPEFHANGGVVQAILLRRILT